MDGIKSKETSWLLNVLAHIKHMTILLQPLDGAREAWNLNGRWNA